MTHTNPKISMPWKACLTFAWCVLALSNATQATAQETPTAPRNWNAVKKNVQSELDRELESLLAFYKHLHQNPEMSFEEEKTAAKLTQELKTLGFEVTTKVGGHGIVGVLRNGEGPTVLVRTDMDALPVTEKTDLPYASKARARNKEGQEVGLMHACGHDMHMTCWLGTARTLVRLKDQWRGTLIFIGQPAEEMGAGARMMLEAGLFKRFPRPDYCLGLHCHSNMAHGTIGYSESILLANADTLEITVRGKGGHGSAPHATIDPIVLSARIILDLQTLVSRENNPLDPVVISVGSIHGGTKHNIIPTEVKLQLTVRTLRDEVRQRVLEGIQRMVKAAAVGARAPEPIIKIDLDNYTPAVFNHPGLAKATAKTLKNAIGEANVKAIPPILGAEDFGRFGREGVPIFFYFLGTLPPAKIAEAEGGKTILPSLHSEYYAPVPEPSIRTGVTTMSFAVLQLLPERTK